MKLILISSKWNANPRTPGENFILSYNALIICTGSRAVDPLINLPTSPFISSFYSKYDGEKFRKAAEKGNIKKAVIVGGGFVGCELTEALRALWGIETILIEKEGSLLSKFLDPEISRLVENRIRNNGVQILLSTDIEKIELNEKNLPEINLRDGTKITSDYLLYNLGDKTGERSRERGRNKNRGSFWGN